VCLSFLLLLLLLLFFMKHFAGSFFFSLTRCAFCMSWTATPPEEAKNPRETFVRYPEKCRDTGVMKEERERERERKKVPVIEHTFLHNLLYLLGVYLLR